MMGVIRCKLNLHTKKKTELVSELIIISYHALVGVGTTAASTINEYGP